MIIDFRKIEVTDLEGNKSTFDVRKELGNTIYNSTTDLGELEFAQEVYKHGEVEVDSEKAGNYTQVHGSRTFFRPHQKRRI